MVRMQFRLLQKGQATINRPAAYTSDCPAWKNRAVFAAAVIVNRSLALLFVLFVLIFLEQP